MHEDKVAVIYGAAGELRYYNTTSVLALINKPPHGEQCFLLFLGYNGYE
jgi:hypothetical protein